MLAARSTSVRGSALATPRSRHASPALPTSVPARGASGFTHHGSYLGASNQFPMSFYDHTDQYVDRRGLGKRALPKDWRPEEWKPSGQNPLEALIRVEQYGGARVVYINSGASAPTSSGKAGKASRGLNRLDIITVRALQRVLARLEDNPAVTMITIRGAHDAVFCSGTDLAALKARAADPRTRDVALAYIRAQTELQHLVAHYTKPLVVGMHGVTLGSGYALAANSRFPYAVSNAAIGVPEVTQGLVPHGGATYHLARAPGGLGMFMATTGATLSGEDAFWGGLAPMYGLTSSGASGDFPEGGWSGAIMRAAGDLSVTPSVLWQLHTDPTYRMALSQLRESRDEARFFTVNSNMNEDISSEQFESYLALKRWHMYFVAGDRPSSRVALGDETLDAEHEVGDLFDFHAGPEIDGRTTLPEPLFAAQERRARIAALSGYAAAIGRGVLDSGPSLQTVARLRVVRAAFAGDERRGDPVLRVTPDARPAPPSREELISAALRDKLRLPADWEARLRVPLGADSQEHFGRWAQKGNGVTPFDTGLSPLTGAARDPAAGGNLQRAVLLAYERAETVPSNAAHLPLIADAARAAVAAAWPHGYLPDKHIDEALTAVGVSVIPETRHALARTVAWATAQLNGAAAAAKNPWVLEDPKIADRESLAAAAAEMIEKFGRGAAPGVGPAGSTSKAAADTAAVADAAAGVASVGSTNPNAVALKVGGANKIEDRRWIFDDTAECIQEAMKARAKAKAFDAALREKTPPNGRITGEIRKAARDIAEKADVAILTPEDVAAVTEWVLNNEDEDIRPLRVPAPPQLAAGDGEGYEYGTGDGFLNSGTGAMADMYLGEGAGFGSGAGVWNARANSRDSLALGAGQLAPGKDMPLGRGPSGFGSGYFDDPEDELSLSLAASSHPYWSDLYNRPLEPTLVPSEGAFGVVQEAADEARALAGAYSAHTKPSAKLRKARDTAANDMTAAAAANAPAEVLEQLITRFVATQRALSEEAARLDAEKRAPGALEATTAIADPQRASLPVTSFSSLLAQRFRSRRAAAGYGPGAALASGYAGSRPKHEAAMMRSAEVLSRAWPEGVASRAAVLALLQRLSAHAPDAHSAAAAAAASSGAAAPAAGGEAAGAGAGADAAAPAAARPALAPLPSRPLTGADLYQLELLRAAAERAESADVTGRALEARAAAERLGLLDAVPEQLADKRLGAMAAPAPGSAAGAAGESAIARGDGGAEAAAAIAAAVESAAGTGRTRAAAAAASDAAVLDLRRIYVRSLLRAAPLRVAASVLSKEGTAGGSRLTRVFNAVAGAAPGSSSSAASSRASAAAAATNDPVVAPFAALLADVHGLGPGRRAASQRVTQLRAQLASHSAAAREDAAAAAAARVEARRADAAAATAKTAAAAAAAEAAGRSGDAVAATQLAADAAVAAETARSADAAAWRAASETEEEAEQLQTLAEVLLDTLTAGEKPVGPAVPLSRDVLGALGITAADGSLAAAATADPAGLARAAMAAAGAARAATQRAAERAVAAQQAAAAAQAAADKAVASMRRGEAAAAAYARAAADSAAAAAADADAAAVATAGEAAEALARTRLLLNWAEKMASPQTRASLAPEAASAELAAAVDREIEWLASLPLEHGEKLQELLDDAVQAIKDFKRKYGPSAHRSEYEPADAQEQYKAERMRDLVLRARHLMHTVPLAVTPDAESAADAAIDGKSAVAAAAAAAASFSSGAGAAAGAAAGAGATEGGAALVAAQKAVATSAATAVDAASAPWSHAPEPSLLSWGALPDDVARAAARPLALFAAAQLAGAGGLARLPALLDAAEPGVATAPNAFVPGSAASLVGPLLQGAMATQVLEGEREVHRVPDACNDDNDMGDSPATYRVEFNPATGTFGLVASSLAEQHAFAQASAVETSAAAEGYGAANRERLRKQEADHAAMERAFHEERDARRGRRKAQAQAAAAGSSAVDASSEVETARAARTAAEAQAKADGASAEAAAAAGEAAAQAAIERVRAAAAAAAAAPAGSSAASGARSSSSAADNSSAASSSASAAGAGAGGRVSPLDGPEGKIALAGLGSAAGAGAGAGAAGAAPGGFTLGGSLSASAALARELKLRLPAALADDPDSLSAAYWRSLWSHVRSGKSFSPAARSAILNGPNDTSAAAANSAATRAGIAQRQRRRLRLLKQVWEQAKEDLKKFDEELAVSGRRRTLVDRDEHRRLEGRVEAAFAAIRTETTASFDESSEMARLRLAPPGTGEGVGGGETWSDVVEADPLELEIAFRLWRKEAAAAGETITREAAAARLAAMKRSATGVGPADGLSGGNYGWDKGVVTAVLTDPNATRVAFGLPNTPDTAAAAARVVDHFKSAADAGTAVVQVASVDEIKGRLRAIVSARGTAQAQLLGAGDAVLRGDGCDRDERRARAAEAGAIATGGASGDGLRQREAALAAEALKQIESLHAPSVAAVHALLVRASTRALRPVMMDEFRALARMASGAGASGGADAFIPTEEDAAGTWSASRSSSPSLAAWRPWPELEAAVAAGTPPLALADMLCRPLRGVSAGRDINLGRRPEWEAQIAERAAEVAQWTERVGRELESGLHTGAMGDVLRRRYRWFRRGLAPSAADKPGFAEAWETMEDGENEEGGRAGAGERNWSPEDEAACEADAEERADRLDVLKTRVAGLISAAGESTVERWVDEIVDRSSGSSRLR